MRLSDKIEIQYINLFMYTRTMQSDSIHFINYV